MPDNEGRYDSIETATLHTSGGRPVRYRRRRFLPVGHKFELFAEVTVTEGDRLDLIAGRLLGSPEEFWRVCDANDAMNPFELTSTPGRRLRIPRIGMEP